jgi:hypothetical protein
MTSWTKIAAALEPPVPESAAQAVLPGLERLDTALQALTKDLPIDTLPWSGCDPR